jgi:CubicO group peptidase (beta-lactamase class C family)
LILTGCGGSSSIRPVTTTTIQPTLAETIDVFLAANFTDDAPGLAVLVIKDGIVTYKNGKGSANKHTNQNINAATGFRIASISKPFTALAIMQLYQQQQIDLGASILTFLPELPASWHAMTVHHLLSHQSGIPDHLNHFPVGGWLETNAEILNYFSHNDTLRFTPGSQVEYNNSGYTLLAEIVARVSGERFADYMQNHLFIPLGMNNSYIADEFSVDRDNDALNYAELRTIHNHDMRIYGGVGQVSSLDDMGLFINALLNGEIIDRQTFELMTQNHSPNFKPDLGYGYGWALVPAVPGIFAHGGSLDGFKSNMELKTNLDIHLLFLSNGGDIKPFFSELGNLIIDFYQQ